MSTFILVKTLADSIQLDGGEKNSELSITISSEAIEVKCVYVRHTNDSYNENNRGFDIALNTAVYNLEKIKLFNNMSRNDSAQCEVSAYWRQNDIFFKTEKPTKQQILNILQVIHSSHPFNKAHCKAIATFTQIPVNEILNTLDLQTNDAIDLNVLLQLQAELLAVKTEVATLKAEVSSLKAKPAELTIPKNGNEEAGQVSALKNQSFFNSTS